MKRNEYYDENDIVIPDYIEYKFLKEQVAGHEIEQECESTINDDVRRIAKVSKELMNFHPLIGSSKDLINEMQRLAFRLQDRGLSIVSMMHSISSRTDNCVMKIEYVKLDEVEGLPSHQYPVCRVKPWTYGEDNIRKVIFAMFECDANIKFLDPVNDIKDLHYTYAIKYDNVTPIVTGDRSFLKTWKGVVTKSISLLRMESEYNPDYVKIDILKIISRFVNILDGTTIEMKGE